MTPSRSVRRRLTVLGAALVLATASVPLASSSTLAAPTKLGVNLVRNPGAEAGVGTNGYSTVDIPEWETTSNFTVVRYGAPEFPTKAEANRIGGGKKFFSCGPNTETAFAEQSVRLKGRGALIDAGQMHITMKVRFAGYLNGSDWGAFEVGFHDATDGVLLTTSVTLPSGTDGVFLFGKTSRPVPVGTRLLAIRLVGNRANDGGSYCDAYFDKVSVVLRAVD